MTSSSPETSLHTDGARRAPHRAPRVAAPRPPARYEPYLDGLFTYCLSVLCDHEAATAVLGEVLAISERQYGRSPTGEPERKAWLYALARWACLRALTEQRAQRRDDRRRGRAGAHAQAAAAERPGGAPAVPADHAADERRRRELALLAWPEAAGTTPEQREVLELAVRHQLGPRGVASVLSMEPAAARSLLSRAAVEVERTRTALAVVETGACPSVARLAADSRVLLSAALRQELVRHVDDCPRCRRTAERVEAQGPWPGATPRPARRSPAVLPLVEADRAAAYAAMLHAPRARGAAPRFGRDGFPLDAKDRAARRDRLRARAVTTTVVATVIAAPVFALWAAYRNAPETGEGHGGPSVSAGEPGGPSSHDGSGYERYENAGNASDGPGADGGRGAEGSDVSVKVLGHGTATSGAGAAGAGALDVTARTSAGRSTITLTAAGAPVSWSASVGASWLSLSRSSGTLAAGQSVTLYVTVDHAREPAGPWRARIALHPTGAVVLVDGYGYPHTPQGGGSPRPGTSGRHGGHGSGGHHGGGPGKPGGSGSPGTTTGPSDPGGSGGPSSPGGSPTDPGSPSGSDGSGDGSGGSGSPGTGDPTAPASDGSSPDPPSSPPATGDDPSGSAPSAS
ncbi:hypothetical protein AB0910_28415 [Streptomyces sp. NPDC047002]|uniref:BACON domain-containing protein n=1 Tax=Streptomyces sp. NPDC047002 TaxID=3155475 RepID=UPI003455D14F